MRKTTKLILAIVIIVVAGIAWGAWFVLGRGFSAREEPTAIEAFVAGRLRSLATPGEGKEAPNPIAHLKRLFRKRWLISPTIARFVTVCVSAFGVFENVSVPIICADTKYIASVRRH
jgi:hypothetical protein